jgi:methionyl-tRNA formyltransferase
MLSRFPRVDTMRWKRALAADLLAQGVELSVVYSRSTTQDQLQAGLNQFGLGVFSRYLESQVQGQARADRAHHESASLAAWARQRGVPVVEQRRLASDDCLAAIRSLSPDVIVLVGADIVPVAILRLARIGTVNAHYGLLPRYRGMNVTEWSIWHDDPVGVTAHMVDPGIDTGDILLQETIAVDHGDTLESLRAKHQASAVGLLAAAVRGLGEGSVPRLPQRPEEGRQYYRMHPELRRRVEKKLASGSYSRLGSPATPLAV